MNNGNNNQTEREDRLTRILLASREGFSFSDAKDCKQARLIDADGEAIAFIPPTLVDVIDCVNDSLALSILVSFHSLCIQRFEQGYKRGKVAGRVELIGTVHSLLGIDRITEALEQTTVQDRG